MKKIVKGLLISLIAVMMFSQSAFADNLINLNTLLYKVNASTKVTVNGVNDEYSTPTYTIDDTTLIRMEELLEDIGATYYWEKKDTLNIYRNCVAITLHINDVNATIRDYRWGWKQYVFSNEKNIVLSTAPISEYGAVMLPLKSIYQAFGYTLETDPVTNTTNIKAPAPSSDKPIDMNGVEIKIGDSVKGGAFRGTVLEIKDNMVKINWWHHSLLVSNENDMVYWEAIGGVQFLTIQWKDSKTVYVDND